MYQHRVQLHGFSIVDRATQKLVVAGGANAELALDGELFAGGVSRVLSFELEKLGG